MESRVFVWGSGFSADPWARVPEAASRERREKLPGAPTAPRHKMGSWEDTLNRAPFPARRGELWGSTL